MASAAIQHQRKIEIPFKGDQVLELEVANLPTPEEAVGILQEQECKIHLWIQLALEYYRQGKHDAFDLLLRACLDRWDEYRVKRESANYPDGFKDRIKALDLLANFYVRRGNATKNRDGKRDYFARAAQKFTEVDKSEFINKHGPEFQYHLVGRAYCCLMEGRSDQAESQFGFVLQQQGDSGELENVPSLLGRACIEFNKKEAGGKRAALGYYKKALQVCPNAPADVRLGLGICFYKLNMPDKAEAAFSRAISLDPKCVGALTGLAIIELNRKTASSIKRGTDYLSRAFKIEPNNSLVCTLLADHFFYANELEKAIKVATRAQENTENDAMLAQACYQLGRAFHRQKDYDKAFQSYYKATQYGGATSFLAFYGLGQMYIHKREYDNAIQAFEAVLKTNENNYETLKILASLYARNDNKKDEARTYLKKVTESHPEDLEAWVELASLCEQTDTHTALAAYRTSIKLYESKSQPVPAEIYNNMAALLFSTEALEESERCYNLALKRCEEEMPNDTLHYESIIYTIKYNISRLHEAKHQLHEAEKLYKEILVAHPMYIDCYLRLGCMDRDRGFLFEASDRFKETFRIDSDNFDAWTLIGNLHLSKQELSPAQRKFDRILNKTKQSPDCYSLVAVGNVWLQSLYLPGNDSDKIAKAHMRALEFYKYALKYDHKNIYAANGVGCLFALKQMYNEARDIFSQVREATADFPDVWINIAHIYVEQRQYAAAVQMYENCLRKFYNNSNTELLLYIARALFKSNKLLECKKVLLRARYLSPNDIVITFNLAKLLKTLARQVFEDRKSTYHAVVTAESELKLAKMFFHHYVEQKEKIKDHDRSFIDLKILQREERDCADLLLQVEKSIKVDAEQRDREENQRRREHEEQLRLELARKAEEEEERIKEERRKKEELENKRRELLKRQEEAKLKLFDEKSQLHADDEMDDGGSRRKKSKTKKKDKGERVERDRERQERDQTSESKKYKSRAILSSDSSSSDEENDNPPMPHGPTIADDDEDDDL